MGYSLGTDGVHMRVGGAEQGWRRTLRSVATLYRMELTSALRDRTIVVNSLLIPVLLYPLLLWLAFLGLTFAMGQGEQLTARVALVDWQRLPPALRSDIERTPGLRAERLAERGGALARLERDQLEAVVEALPAGGAGAALAENFAVRITYDGAREASDAARRRVRASLDRHREQWLARAARGRGLSAASWQVFDLEQSNAASRRQMGAYLLASLLPLLFGVMVLLGSFHPAIDATAGERERGTWETLLASPAERLSIVVAKYLYVVTFGALAGLANFLSMALTVEPIMRPIFARAGEPFDLTLRVSSLPVVVLGAVLLAGLGGAGMMLFASFARTFKEGQSLITPFYLLMMLPMLLVQDPGTQLSTRTALLPGANVVLLVRAALAGTVSLPTLGLVCVASLASIALLLALTAFALRFEDVITGSYRGSFLAFVKTRARGAREVHP
jgi:sodium transport system permease protein